MVETMIILPIMLILGFGIVHAGLLFQAQSNLEYAALMAARVGASTSIDLQAMEAEVLRRMRASDPRLRPDYDGGVIPDMVITVLNPTYAMFDSCGRRPTYNPDVCDGPFGECEIPNFGLQFRDRSGDALCDSQATVQDANILRIQVRYGIDTKVPFMDWIQFPGSNQSLTDDPDGLIQNGYPVTAIATVRMQSPARITFANQAAFPTGL